MGQIITYFKLDYRVAPGQHQLPHQQILQPAHPGTTMGPTEPPPSLPSPGKPTSPPSSTSIPTKPFPLLSLPKELRQKIFTHLRPITRHHFIPLKSGPHHLTLVTTTIPGISLLATNRQIQTEASYVLSPHLSTIKSTPPTIIISAEHLLGVINLHDSFRFQRTFWTFLFHRIEPRNRAFTTRSIRHYRQGSITSSQLAKKLKMWTLTTSPDPDLGILEAVTSFILRILAYLPTATSPPTLHTYPPLNILIDIPTSFTGGPITATTSLPRSIAYRIFFPTHPYLARTRPGFTNLSWLLQRMVCHACWAFTCRRETTVCLSIKVRFLDGEGEVLRGWAGGAEGWGMREVVVHKSVLKGVKSARMRGRGLFIMGGWEWVIWFEDCDD